MHTVLVPQNAIRLRIRWPVAVIVLTGISVVTFWSIVFCIFIYFILSLCLTGQC